MSIFDLGDLLGKGAQILVGSRMLSWHQFVQRLAGESLDHAFQLHACRCIDHCLHMRCPRVLQLLK